MFDANAAAECLLADSAAGGDFAANLERGGKKPMEIAGVGEPNGEPVVFLRTAVGVHPRVRSEERDSGFFCSDWKSLGLKRFGVQSNKRQDQKRKDLNPA